MGVVFKPGHRLTRSELSISIQNAQGAATNAAAIWYTLYYVDPGPPEAEVLLGEPRNEPVNPSVGEYYASFEIPQDATLGTYRIRWYFRELVNSPIQEAVQEFAVVEVGTTINESYSKQSNALIRRLRIMLRDQNPDKFYRFRPPEHENKIGRYNQVFGQIWEDEELYEYLNISLERFNSAPPFTLHLSNLDKLHDQFPAWKAAVCYGAVSAAAMALSANWIADEFSVSGDTLLRVRIDGKEEVLTIENLWRRVQNEL